MACLMAGSCRLVLVDVAVGKNLVQLTATVEEQRKKASANAGSSYDEAAVVQTWKAYCQSSMMA